MAHLKNFSLVILELILIAQHLYVLQKPILNVGFLNDEVTKETMIFALELAPRAGFEPAKF